MAITMNLYYTGENGSALSFVKEMMESGTVEKIRKEKGNLRYEYFQMLSDPETILLIDSWESQEALDEHHRSPMMGRIMELRDKYNLHMRAERYVSDDAGISDADKKFIKESIKAKKLSINNDLDNSETLQ